MHREGLAAETHENAFTGAAQKSHLLAIVYERLTFRPRKAGTSAGFVPVSPFATILHNVTLGIQWHS